VVTVSHYIFHTGATQIGAETHQMNYILLFLNTKRNIFISRFRE